jgi:mannose-1-phosphate guanylyltransferase
MELIKSAYNEIQEAPGAFSSIAPVPEHIWGIILAGGNGERVRTLTSRWKGRHVPKQYCAFVGSRTMLQHTLDRAGLLIKPERQKILIARAHRREAFAQLPEHWHGSVIIQPENRDTLPGILLPLTYVYKQDAKATVMVFPSDHFIHPNKKFAQVVAGAAAAAEDLPDRLLLIGAPADSPEPDYGWVLPGSIVWRSGTRTVYAVKRFLEKPLRAGAAEAMAHGGLWNTLIIAVKAHTLWRLGWNYFPEIMKLFELLRDSIGSPYEREVLESIYAVMPSENFSTGLLTRAAHRIGVLPMNGILWSDWGKEKRIVGTLLTIGKKPNFPCPVEVMNGRVTRKRTQSSHDYVNVHL